MDGARRTSPGDSLDDRERLGGRDVQQMRRPDERVEHDDAVVEILGDEALAGAGRASGAEGMRVTFRVCAIRTPRRQAGAKKARMGRAFWRCTCRSGRQPSCEIRPPMIEFQQESATERSVDLPLRSSVLICAFLFT